MFPRKWNHGPWNWMVQDDVATQILDLNTHGLMVVS